MLVKFSYAINLTIITFIYSTQRSIHPGNWVVVFYIIWSLNRSNFNSHKWIAYCAEKSKVSQNKKLRFSTRLEIYRKRYWHDKLLEPCHKPHTKPNKRWLWEKFFFVLQVSKIRYWTTCKIDILTDCIPYGYTEHLEI